jgi:hypothetical protein
MPSRPQRPRPQGQPRPNEFWKGPDLEKKEILTLEVVLAYTPPHVLTEMDWPKIAQVIGEGKLVAPSVRFVVS